MQAAAHVLLLGLVAAASPLALTATLVVVSSERPRSNGIAFASGFLLGGMIACGAGLLLGSASVSRLDNQGTVQQTLGLVAGIVLVVLGLWERRRPPGGKRASGRAGAILERLSRVRPGEALASATVLGFGGPKRLVLTLLAMAAISTADRGLVEDATLVAVYLALATSLVWVPVAIVVVAGERATAMLHGGEAWLTVHAAQLRVGLSLGVGSVLTGYSLVRLVAGG